MFVCLDMKIGISIRKNTYRANDFTHFTTLLTMNAPKCIYITFTLQPLQGASSAWLMKQQFNQTLELLSRG